jgi:hypothetical protein
LYTCPTYEENMKNTTNSSDDISESNTKECSGRPDRDRM